MLLPAGSGLEPIGEPVRRSPPAQTSRPSPSGPSTTGGRPERSTDTLPAAVALYEPLIGSRGSLGVLAVELAPSSRPLTPDQRELRDALARQIAAPLERAVLAAEAERSRWRQRPNAPEHAPELGVPRPADAARRDHRGGERAARRRGALAAPRPRARLDRPGRGRAAQPPGPKPPRHDAPGVRHPRAQARVALDRGGGRLRARSRRTLRRRAKAARRASSPTCRSSGSTPCSSSRPSSTCSRTPSATAEAHRCVSITVRRGGRAL